MTTIYLLATLQAFFLISLLLAKKQKSFADKVLMAWLAGIGIHTLIYFLWFQYQLSPPLIINLNAAFPYLQGPFLLAYTAALTGTRERFAGFDYLHLLPFAGFISFLLSTHGPAAFSLSQGESSFRISMFSMTGFFSALLLLSVPVYIIASLVLMRRAARALDGPELPARFRWIRFCIVGLGVVWTIVIFSFAFSQGGGHSRSPHLVFVALTLFVYGLGYLGMSRTAVFTEPELESLKKQLQPKYSKSGLPPEEAEALHRRLVSYMGNDKPFLDSNISLQSLANGLGVSGNHLSQVINAFEQCNFYDLMNSRRIQEACRRLDEAPGSNLLELAMDVGFNSKSSFNRAFRKHSGKSPSEYTANS